MFFSSAKLSAFAGTALRGIADVAKVGVSKVAESSRGISRQVTASGVPGQVSAAVSGAVSGSVAAVKGAVENPEAALGSLWSSARGLFSTASTFVTTQLSGAEGGGGDRGSSPTPERFRTTDADDPAASAPGRPPLPPAREAAGFSDAGAGRSRGGGASAASSSAAAQAATPADDTEAWLAAQVAAVQLPQTKAAAKKPVEWNAWLDDDDDGTPSAGGGGGGEGGGSSAPPTKATVASAARRPSGGGAAAPPSRPEPKSDDDFFTQWS